MEHTVANYRRTLDLATAAARVTYQRDGVAFARDHFVSAPDEVFVSRLTGPVSFTVSLDRPERFETKTIGDDELLMTGTLNDGRGGQGVSYAARLRVLAKGGSCKADGNTLRVTSADEAVLLLVLGGRILQVRGVPWPRRVRHSRGWIS